MENPSFNQALELIKAQPDKYNTAQSLKDLIQQVDMGGKGDITLFYSGSYGDISAQSIVKAMDESGDSIRIIDNTQVAKLLDSDEFIASVAKEFGITDSREIKLAYNDRTTPSSLNQFFFDAENGLWADASRRFAAETVGEVRTLTANTRLHTQIR